MPRERGDFPGRGRRRLGGWYRQLLDRRRRHVRRHAQPDQVVHDEAVEQPAEKMLIARRQRRAEAENRVGRDAAGGQHRGDERQPIGGARDVAVRQARAIVAIRPQPPLARRRALMLRRTRVERRRETARCVCLRRPGGRDGRPGTRRDRRSRSARARSAPTSRTRCRAAERATRRARRSRDRTALRRLGSDEPGTGDPLEQRRRDPHRKPRRRGRGLVPDRLQLRRVVDAKAARDRTGRRAVRRRDEQEADAAMNRKDAAVVVHPDDGVDVALREQHPPQRRAPVVGGEA